MHYTLNTMIAICLTAIPLLGQTNPSPNRSFRLGVLRHGQISEGCGEYYYLSKARVGSGDYVFATAPDKISKVISIDGKLHVLEKGVSWNNGQKSNGESENHYHFVEIYSDPTVRIELHCFLDGELGEGATISGKMRVTVNKVTRIFTVNGEMGCD